MRICCYLPLLATRRCSGTICGVCVGSATRMETVDEAARSLQTETIRAEHFAELNIGRRETLGSLISGSPHGHGSTARRCAFLLSFAIVSVS